MVNPVAGVVGESIVNVFASEVSEETDHFQPGV